MIYTIIRKLLFFILSLYTVATITFFLMKVIPGDPFVEEQGVPKEILQAIRHYYGLDFPLYKQYLCYIKGLCLGDLGPSFKYRGCTTCSIIRQTFPVSCTLGGIALAFALMMGILMGGLSAFFQHRWQDRLCGFIGVIGLATPSFLLAAIVQYLFAMKWDLFPVALWGEPRQVVLPVMALAAFPMAFIMRLIRSGMAEEMHKDYIYTAKSKGIHPFRIVWVHLLRNTLLPVISYLGPLVASVLTGSFIVEKIFGIPGLGYWFVSSVIARDYTIIMGLTLFYSAVLMICTFIGDVLHCLLDPRISMEAQYE